MLTRKSDRFIWVGPKKLLEHRPDVLTTFSPPTSPHANSNTCSASTNNLTSAATGCACCWSAPRCRAARCACCRINTRRCQFGGKADCACGRWGVWACYAGDGYYFPTTLPHKFRNIGADEAEIISANTPANFWLVLHVSPCAANKSDAFLRCRIFLSGGKICRVDGFHSYENSEWVRDDAKLIALWFFWHV